MGYRLLSCNALLFMDHVPTSHLHALHTPYLSSGGGSRSSVHPVHTCGWHFPPESACPCSCNAQRLPLCSCLQTFGHEVESQDGRRTPLWEESKRLSGFVWKWASIAPHMHLVGSEEGEETLISMSVNFPASSCIRHQQTKPAHFIILFLNWKQRLLCRQHLVGMQPFYFTSFLIGSKD